MTPEHDPESAAPRTCAQAHAIEAVGGPLTLTPKLTHAGPLDWTISYCRRLRLPGDTVEIDDEVSAYGLLACLAALERRIAEQDAALLAYLRAREEAPRGEAGND